MLLPILLLAYLSCSCMKADALANQSAAKRLQSLYSKNKNENSAAVIVPGVHDALSAKIYATTGGAKCLFLSGFGVTACRLGQPDVGILTLTEMEDSLRAVVQAVSGDKNIPVIVDGDTGYGGAINVRRTIRAFAAAGAAAVTIEDQVFPKKCPYAAASAAAGKGGGGGGGGVPVVSRQESMVRIKAALEARDEALNVDGNEILVVARTDCRAALGLQEAIERCKMYEALGADLCYAENLQSREEYEYLRSQLLPTTRTILAQVQTGDNKEQTLYSAQDVGEMKYDFALFGVTALQAYVGALERSAMLMMMTPHPDSNSSSSSGLIIKDDSSNLDIASFGTLKRIIGFEESESFQAKFDC